MKPDRSRTWAAKRDRFARSTERQTTGRQSPHFDVDTPEILIGFAAAAFSGFAMEWLTAWLAIG
jgi:hypothetical protein